MKKIIRIVSIVTLLLSFTICYAYGYESGTYGFIKDGSSINYFQYPGALWTAAKGISDDGKIVGTYQDFTGTHGFLRSGDLYTSLDYPGANSTMPYDINDAGKIVGMYLDQGIPGVAGSAWHSFLMEGNTYTQLNYPGALSTYGTYVHSINNSDQIAGEYFTKIIQLTPTSTTIDDHGFLKDGITYTSFDIPGAYVTGATGINDAGQIVGYYANWNDGGKSHGFKKDGDIYTYFDGPGSNTKPLSINDAGQIILNSGLLEGNIYTSFSFPTQIIDYGPGRYDILTFGMPSLSSINDTSVIVGSVYINVKSVPEPTTMLLLSLGLIGLVGIRKRWAYRLNV